MPVCHAHLAEPVEMSSLESHPPRCSASHAGAKCAVGGGTNWATASAPGQEFQYSATAQGRLACGGVGVAKPRTVPVASVPGYRYPHMVYDGSSCTKRLWPESGATTRWDIPCLLAEGSCESSPMKREAQAVPVGSAMGVCHLMRKHLLSWSSARNPMGLCCDPKMWHEWNWERKITVPFCDLHPMMACRIGALVWGFGNSWEAMR